MKLEKSKNTKLNMQLQSALQKNSKLAKCVKFMQSLDIDDVLVREKENRRLMKARRKLDKELEKCKENYQITK